MRSSMLVLVIFIFAAGWVTPGPAQVVLVNQAGYLPGEAKFVYFLSAADSFMVIDQSNGTAYFADTLHLTAVKDPSTGNRTYRGDFSALTRTGTYVVATTNGDTSFPFVVSPSAYNDVAQKSIKGFYYQRCGGALLASNAGVYARAACHTHDGVYHSTTGKTGSHVCTGGWHDAGDYGKYTVNAGVSVGTLLLAYELSPATLQADNLNIPESGNGVPDILDEVRYELAWLLTMQDSADGGVYFKVTTENFDGFEMPSSDAATRYIYQKSSTATGDFCAMMAQAARVYQPFDTAFSSQCLAAARRAWVWLSANSSIVPAGGFQNPAGTNTGGYGDTYDADERLWAAAELFETTGEDTYHSYFKNHYNDPGVFTQPMSWPNVGALAQAEYLFGSQTGTIASIKTSLHNGLITYCSSLLSVVDADGLNVSLLPTNYIWGSNSNVLNNAIMLILGWKEGGNADYKRAALQQLNYILGCNRLDRTFVTGVGTVSPMNPHHRPSYSDGVVAPIPGLMVGGPDHGLDDAILASMFNSSTPPARCYADNWQSYASNEIAINWNAPLVFVSSYFSASSATGFAEPIHADVPSSLALRQNYPNPFNPTTTIQYTVGGVRGQASGLSAVRITVYDVLGRVVSTLVDARQAPGTYEVRFDASHLGSGVYFYRLEVDNQTATRAMTLIR